MQRAPIHLYRMKSLCCSEDRMKPNTIASQQQFCAIWLLFLSFDCSRNCTCTFSLVNYLTACSLYILYSPCTSCSYPLCKVSLLQMFPCLPTQLPWVEWGFFWLHFVCLSICLDVWGFCLCSNACFTCRRNSWSFFGIRCLYIFL